MSAKAWPLDSLRLRQLLSRAHATGIECVKPAPAAGRPAWPPLPGRSSLLVPRCASFVVAAAEQRPRVCRVVQAAAVVSSMGLLGYILLCDGGRSFSAPDLQLQACSRLHAWRSWLIGGVGMSMACYIVSAATLWYRSEVDRRLTDRVNDLINGYKLVVQPRVPLLVAVSRPQRPLTSSLLLGASASFSRSRMTLALDLDETLLHSTLRPSRCVGAYDTKLELFLDRRVVTFYAFHRPHVHLFLSYVSRWFDVVIYTASQARYADPVIDRLDRNGVVRRRYYRESCIYRSGSYLKDLSVVRQDLARVMIIDNSPIAYLRNPCNAIPIKSWAATDPADDELLNLLPLLNALRAVQDVRSVLSLRTKSHVAPRPFEMSASSSSPSPLRSSLYSGGAAAGGGGGGGRPPPSASPLASCIPSAMEM